MSISQADKRLYAFCEDILDSNQLDPVLHEELSRLLNNSTLKEYYYIDKSLAKDLETMTKNESNLKKYIKETLNHFHLALT